MNHVNEEYIGREVYSKGSWTPEDTDCTLRFHDNGRVKRLAWFDSPEILSQILLPKQQKQLFDAYDEYNLIYNGFMQAWEESKKGSRR